ncbi:type II toxin-antitoxin system RelE/ParE family toxin [Aromatoleum evansii]|uniref:type II toxin-antitoxin system RelE/ParE family toxin n=1 Tax=Aromatoleum evansii TaxID=59406 RepID=UPI00145D4B3E|nr:type II toxin-antitoxin system RelE/ParE family toxin [Aromatoleum evansii]
MKVKPVVPREQANRDVDDAVAYYLDEGAAPVALGFIDALEQAYTHIGRQPGTGSPRYGHELDLPGLRFWSLSRYPYLVFYVERPDHIDVWRVLHSQRDIPAWMQDPDALA